MRDMKRKISGALAASLIVSQMQGVAFAENTTSTQDIDTNKDDVSQSTESIVDVSNTETVQEDVKTEEITVQEDVESEVAEVQEEAASEEETVQEEVKVEEADQEEGQQPTTTTPYKQVGKLELDLNFAMPIKHTDQATTNLSVKLKDKNNNTEVVELGSDTTSGTLPNGISYTLQALNSKKEVLKEGETDVLFYHLTFENLELGQYGLEVSGDGYQTTTVDEIDITSYSKRVLLGTSENTIVLDDKGTEDKDDDIKEHYPGALLVGNVNSDNSINQDDYDALKAEIKSTSNNTSKFDLNRDGKVDITDLTYVHQNMDKTVNKAIILNTDVIVNPDKVDVKLPDTTLIENGTDIKDVLKDNGSTVALKTSLDAPISQENPISMQLNLVGTTREATSVEQISIKAPSENAPTSGTIVIPGAGEDGGNLEIPFSQDNVEAYSLASSDGQTQSEIVVNLGKQVAVSQITINVTGSRSNKNLTEISKVDFLNNVYKEVPKPKMNIPVINYFKSATAVGSEHMVLGWDHETNVTGYELKVEELNENGSVKSTSTYKTSENTLKIEGVKGYATYRVSIQSLSGEWKSGFKDEQEGYVADATGETNIKNNSNDKDGVPDNADTNYNPKAWDSKTGVLETKADGENGNKFGADSIVELQVIPETAPEGPEGIRVEGTYKGLNVTWKSHKKAKDYDLYYRKVGGDGAWIKANDPNNDYVDANPNNNIPDDVINLTPEQKADKDELIRGTSYTITGLEDQATYEIKMTATNHHGTGGLSQTYLGTTTSLVPPVIPNYKLINTPNESGELTNHIEKVEFNANPSRDEGTGEEMFDNDYSTAYVKKNWTGGVSYEANMPRVTFDQEYTFDTVRFAVKLDNPKLYGAPYAARIDVYDEAGNRTEKVEAKVRNVRSENGVSYVEVKLVKPVTAKTVSLKADVYGTQHVSMSEVKFYHYDTLQEEVDALFKDTLKLELNDDVTQERIDELLKRANAIDPVNMEYHPNQTAILSDLQRAEDLLNDIKLSDKIITLDPGIRNIGTQKSIGQSNDYQALGVAVKPGDKVTIYIGSPRKDTKFKLGITQHYAESGSALTTYSQDLVVGKNEISIPESAFNMDYEKGGNLYLRFDKLFADGQVVQVRVSGGTEIPHLNLNNMIDDASKEGEVKDAIRTYIRQLKSYVNTLPDRYPTTGDKVNNIYTYDPKTSILNSTDIEGDRITLSLAADQVLKGITEGLSTEDEQVNRLYDNLLAWEQLMKVSYVQQGLLETAIDFDGDGKITNTALAQLNGKSEQKFFTENQAPLNRINIKYQRMFTGAFMYASSHHVGIDYGSVAGMMKGVPFKFDEKGNLVNKDEAGLFGWGINHEIGHVHDVNGLTYAEVTNNILALITQTFDDEDQSRFEVFETAYEEIYDKVTSGSVGLASSGLVKLGMFWQLHLAYDNDNTYKMLDLNTDNTLDNDTFYAKLYRVTREKGIAPNEAGHDKVAQTFIMRASDAIGKDLREFFEKWGIVASPNTNTYLNQQNYPKEDKAIYYLNDNARRQRLEAIQNNNIDSLTMAQDTIVSASFGTDKDGNKINDKTYLNQKEVPLQLSVNKDQDKILGYEIIKLEATSQGVKEVVSGFVERNAEGNITEYVDVIDAVNNRTFAYKVRAYDYNLNVTQVTEIGTVKVSHDGSIAKSDWKFATNTRGAEDVADENTGHGHVENGSINKIKDNDKSTVYEASKATNHNGQTVSGDPYVTIEMDKTKSVVGLKYTPGETVKNKFSLKNLFTRNNDVTYSPISKYEVYVSQDGTNWTKAHSGTFDTTRENTIYFNEKGTSENSQLWSYDAKYVKLVAKGASTISIAELDILGPQGDNIEIGMDNYDQVYTNGIGKLKSDYEYAEGKVIPAGSLLVMGEYKGDPAFNVPLVLNEDNDNFALKAQAVLLANLPEDAELGEVAEGNWIYWITPEQQDEKDNIKGSKVKAELYRYNKLEQGAPVGQRLVSDTFFVDIDVDNLPTIDLTNSNVRTLTSSYNEVVEIDSEALQTAMENR